MATLKPTCLQDNFPKETKEIVETLVTNLSDCRGTLKDFRRLYPQVSTSITTMIAARAILNKQQQTVNKLGHSGELDKGAVEKLVCACMC